METSPSSFPGWYVDPATPGMLRWWNGRQWEKNTKPVGGSTPSRPATPAMKTKLAATMAKKPSIPIPAGIKITYVILAIAWFIGVVMFASGAHLNLTNPTSASGSLPSMAGAGGVGMVLATVAFLAMLFGIAPSLYMWNKAGGPTWAYTTAIMCFTLGIAGIFGGLAAKSGADSIDRQPIEHDIQTTSYRDGYNNGFVVGQNNPR